jgi:hypothetical protein
VRNPSIGFGHQAVMYVKKIERSFGISAVLGCDKRQSN